MAPTGNIEVSKLDGTERRVVVKDLAEPTGITLLHGGKFVISAIICLSVTKSSLTRLTCYCTSRAVNQHGVKIEI